jgi:hypothetical protein
MPLRPDEDHAERPRLHDDVAAGAGDDPEVAELNDVELIAGRRLRPDDHGGHGCECDEPDDNAL